MSRGVPVLNLQAQYTGLREAIHAAVERVFARQEFILGEEVEALEVELAAWLEVDHVVACASGTDALRLALMALDIGPGDEVITTPFSFFATASAIALSGARPVFADIEAASFNLNPAELEARISPRTRAIMPVHLYGRPASMGAIRAIAERHHLPVIEDAAQAIGATYGGQYAGTLGTLGCFSFYPTKNLGGAGDGGMLVTSDAGLAARLRRLRAHGSSAPYIHTELGLNSRLDALQAAVLRAKLPHLQSWNAGRRDKAAAYSALFLAAGLTGHVALPGEPEDGVHAWHQYVIRLPRRDAARQFLAARGIQTQVYYPMPLHLQPALAYLGHQAGEYPESERASREVLALPLYPELPREHQLQVVQAISDFVRAA